MRSILRLTPLAGLLAVAAGCSDGATGPDAGGLTREEAVQLATGISETSSDALGVPSASNSTAASLSVAPGDPLSVSRRIDVEAPCPLGGTVAIEGTFDFSVDGETQSGSLETEATMVHRDCGVRLEEGSLTLNGEPDLTVASEFAWAGGEQTTPLRVTQAGSIAWARDTGETGTCEVSLVAVTDLVARRRTVEGTFCGFRVAEETTWSPDAG